MKLGPLKRVDQDFGGIVSGTQPTSDTAKVLYILRTYVASKCRTSSQLSYRAARMAGDRSTNNVSQVGENHFPGL